MIKNKKHITEEDFRRYLENRMTETERNAFERKLQKHPFEAEAMEGLQQFPAKKIQKDLNDLSKRLSLKNKKTNTRSRWAAAATLLLLVSAGVIWFQLKDKSPTPELAKTKSVQKQEQAVIPETQAEIKKITDIAPGKMKKDTETDKLILPTEKKEIQITEPVPEKKREKTAKITTEELHPEPSEELVIQNKIQLKELDNLAATEIKSTDAKSESQIRIRGISSHANSARKNEDSGVHFEKASGFNPNVQKIIRGKVVSADDSMPIAGATVFQKGTSNGSLTDVDGNFALELSKSKPDSIVASFVGMETVEIEPDINGQNIVTMPMSDVALNEVVVRDNTANPRKTLKQSSSNEGKVVSSIEAQPIGGMEEFYEYLDNNAILPFEHSKNRVAVKIILTIDSDGNIANIKNKNDADSELFEKAKEIIQEGPGWAPEIKNSEKIESKVDLKIVFHKK